MKYFIPLMFLSLMISCKTNSQQTKLEEPKEVRADKLIKSDEEWKAQLSEMEYYVIRDKGTERSFSGEYWDFKGEGTYVCRACQLPLFSSETKFKSGTGWPSYYEPVDKSAVKEDTDYNLGYARTEVLCARCDGHLGHVFPDGPKPTGLRYCINSVSVLFEGNQETDK